MDRQLLVVFWTLVMTLLIKREIFCEVFSASTDVKDTFHLEQQVVDILEELVAQTETTFNVLDQFLKDHKSAMEEEAADEEEFLERVVGNPIHAYRLLKRLFVDLNGVEYQLNNTAEQEWQDALQRLQHLHSDSRFPEEEDLSGAAQALVRLQDVYELNLDELVDGILWGTPTQAELSAEDCLVIGMYAFHMGEYARAVEWIEQSYILAGLENNPTVTQDFVVEILDEVQETHDQLLLQAAEKPSVLAKLFRQPLKEKPAVVQRRDVISNRKYNLGQLNSSRDDEINFKALCRGEQLLDSSSLIRQLSCWYDSRDQDYFRIMPIRVEQHSFDPVIYTFYEIISDNEIKILKDLATPELSRSMTKYQAGIEEEISRHRISKTAWLDESDHPALIRLSRRISLATGLAADSLRDEAELLEVANYGIGGHFSPHYDYLMDNLTDSDLEQIPSSREVARGDRIASFMFYLNDVNLGGSTVFPRIGVAIKPVKGSAVFWFNLKRNGKANPLTLHGGCPVVLGEKWVCTKWIGERAQIFRRSCTSNADE